jgi:3-deoxy-D-manno-octulosonic-acid transferase
MPVVTGWLLNLIYVALLTAVSPVLAYRAWRHGKYRDGWGQKLLGRGEARASDRPCLWLHAVSVGEVLLLRPVIEEIRRKRPDVEIWLSTTTHTGQAVAREKFPDCQVLYFPLDFTWSVRRALDRVRPDVVGLVELELWPNFIRAVADRGIPLVLVNGRIGEKSFRGYRRIRFLMRRVLGAFTSLGMQSPEYARRMIELGAVTERVTVTGSVKFDGVSLKRDEKQLATLRAALGITSRERVLLAGSTHAPEEQILLDTYARLRTEFPDLRLMIAPRHQERFDEVAGLIHAAGWQVRRRSQSTIVEAGVAPAVILLDTLGELSACWGLAEVAFVGGSLSTRGGQNMLEPCAVGAAVVVGPNTWNFRPAIELLTGVGGLATVHNGDELDNCLRTLLIDTESANSMRSAARTAIQSQQGATALTVQLLLHGIQPNAERRRIAA